MISPSFQLYMGKVGLRLALKFISCVYNIEKSMNNMKAHHRKCLILKNRGFEKRNETERTEKFKNQTK
jgi:hypothetical protein